MPNKCAKRADGGHVPDQRITIKYQKQKKDKIFEKNGRRVFSYFFTSMNDGFLPAFSRFFFVFSNSCPRLNCSSYLSYVVTVVPLQAATKRVTGDAKKVLTKTSRLNVYGFPKKYKRITS